MPTYEYACRSCGEHLEIVQSFADAPLTECPACKGELRKVFSPIGISFKGSGFYKTDSRGSSKEPAKASSSDTASKSDSSGSSGPGSSSSEGAKSTTTSSSGGSSGSSGSGSSSSSGSSGSSSGAGSSGSAAAS